MSTDNYIEARLWDYVDGLSDDAEKSVIEDLIKQDAQWREKYQEILELNRLMADSDLEQPSMRFTKNVMDEITRLHIAPATKSYINKNIIRGLAIFFLSMIVGFLVYGFGQVDYSAGTESKLPVDFSNVDYSVFFNNTWVNAFMMLNMILGLFLLDQVLTERKKKWKAR